MKFSKITQRGQVGFTLIELMIVVAIVGILAVIGVPAYQNYSARAKFSEVVSNTGTFKTAVEMCAIDQGAVPIAACAAGSNGVPAPVSTVGNYTSGVTVAADGTITATAVNGSGLAGQTYVLKPNYTLNGGVSWSTTSGTCFTDTPKLC